MGNFVKLQNLTRPETEIQLFSMHLSSFQPVRCSIPIAILLAVTGFILVSTNIISAQTFPSHEVQLDEDSGDIYHEGQRSEVVWEQTIKLREAVWLRLYFDRLVLAHDIVGNTSSTLRITSLKDGAVQILDARSARQWSNSSAYFNGNGVKLELIAYPNGRLNRLSVKYADSGEVPPLQIPRTICDEDDDRVLSADPRVGRTAPGGCTAWLFNDRQNCLLTAGHCAASAQVMLFNVPVSNSDGSYNQPPPEDQYPIDQSSMQFSNNGVGDDWCYFGCFNNSNTGLSPFEAQDDSFILELPQAVSGGDLIRITGHGTTSAPVDPSFNGAQKTHTGPYSSLTGTTLRYRTDTTGGNSGSPVIFENDGTAIGIHTHGGCSDGGAGSNAGTGSNRAELQTALANPLGVCRSKIEFEFPDGRPEKVIPAGGTTFRVNVSDGGVVPASGTGMLHVDSGSGYEAFPMIELATNEYDAVFPATPCGTVVNYYVSVESDQGEDFTEPADAPTSFFAAISASNISIVFSDDFEADLGWTVSGDATDGQWERGVPAGAGDRGDPSADGDGSGSCFLTDNVSGNSDVDGGSTTLTSPLMDASVGSGQQAVLSYYRWFNNAAGASPQEDVFEVEISNDDGANWEPLETVGPTGSEVFGGWVKKQFLINDTLEPTAEMRLRFTASDLGNGSVVEAAVDGVEIQIIDCVTVGVAINQGELQRSMLLDWEVSFAGDVEIGESAFSLEKVGDGDVPVSFASLFEGNRTIADLSFSGRFTEPSGSLVDGNYQLTINGDSIIDSQGIAVDVDEDGTPGGILVVGDEESEACYRLFGDVDQNRSVDVFDLLGFRQTYQLVTGDASFDASFDFNIDGLIDVFDLLKFRLNYRKTLPFDRGRTSTSKSKWNGTKKRR
jgi:hypothetical protein